MNEKRNVSVCRGHELANALCFKIMQFNDVPKPALFTVVTLSLIHLFRFFLDGGLFLAGLIFQSVKVCEYTSFWEFDVAYMPVFLGSINIPKMLCKKWQMIFSRLRKN